MKAYSVLDMSQVYRVLYPSRSMEREEWQFWTIENAPEGDEWILDNREGLTEEQIVTCFCPRGRYSARRLDAVLSRCVPKIDTAETES